MRGVLLVLGLAACAGEPTALLDPLGWQSTTEDPWGGGPPCDTWWWEEGVVELSTEACAWPTLMQPIRRDLEPGEVLDGGVVWDTLYADAPAEAVLGVALGDQVVWQDTVPIPSGPGDAQFELDVEAGMPAGTPLYLHVHNHGLNTYDFVLP